MSESKQQPMRPPDRPDFPPSYGVHRESGEGAIPWDEVSGRIAKARNYWVATARPDGRPHAVPVWGVWLDQSFYFATDRASRKARNLAANPALVMHLESGDDVVILEGLAEIVGDSALLTRFADAYETKYRFRPNARDAGTVVYRLRPLVAFAWLEVDFPRTATRWRFGD